MPLTPETSRRAGEMGLVVRYLNSIDADEIQAGLINISKGVWNYVESQKAQGVSEAKVIEQCLQTMERIVAELPEAVIWYRRNLLLQLKNTTNIELQTMIVVPWEKPLWTSGLERMAREKGVQFPW